ncbi:MAG: hypothetical protein GXO12_04365 [Epsilonproteobacteria bacterium]|nr:hypothetical protein [Campylobacterota bacterium]
MGIKRYAIFAILFLVAVGVYVYTFNGGTYTLTVFGVPLTLPVALWIILPAVVIAIGSILHMLYYSIKGYFIQRNLQKDYKTFLKFSKSRILGLEEDGNFKTTWYKLPARILKHFRFDATKDPDDIEDEEIKNTILDLKKIEKGESVNLKKYKLPEDNYFVRKNKLNKLAEDKRYAEEILNECQDDKKDDEICKQAFEVYATYTTYSNIKKQGFKIDKALFEKLLDRIIDPDDFFSIENDELYELIKSFDYSKTEYVKLAKKLKQFLNPETLISLYEKLSTEKDAAMQAYLYILFEYQMIDKAREILESSAKNELEKFKYFLFLRDNGKNFDIDIFFDV